MKPIGNIAHLLDFSKPVTGKEVKAAIARMKAQNQPLTLAKAKRAGYELHHLHPAGKDTIPGACAAFMGSRYRPIPKFVKAANDA